MAFASNAANLLTGVTYGVPTNNETMALIWNADIFKRAGLDPDSPPKTWDDVVAYSKQIHDKLGIAGYGLVARKNAGKLFRRRRQHGAEFQLLNRRRQFFKRLFQAVPVALRPCIVEPVPQFLRGELYIP